ncbi:hypothetical protein [Oligoflexus tunisiensis]|uniref:hypothetical protein n=1 Tax=Oligoflexus tunisiensis TaxID=708132 RepID=UPI00114CD643|nr:hypothetical protein [Oligoflexus tunisiensis]
MLSLKNLFLSAVAFLLLNACGTSPKETTRQPNPVDRTETTAKDSRPQAPVTEAQPTDMPSSSARDDERTENPVPTPAPVSPPVPASTPTPTPAPETATAPAQDSSSIIQVNCAFNINGKSYVGNSKAECDKLKKDLGFQF